MLASYQKSLHASFVAVFYLAVALGANAQSGGNATSVTGTVLDPSGAVVPNATVEIHNPVSGFFRRTVTDTAGKFTIPNVPFNPYHLTVTGQGFAPYAQDIEVRSGVPLNINIGLKIAGSSESVTVEAHGGDLVENDPTFHTDVDQAITDRLPLQSVSSGVSSLVTLVTPGIAADSNGLFHGMGDHAQNSFSVDNQPISDQQSKVFSNQLPTDSIQSLEVISGAPPAEFGDKTSIVIKVTTRSGLGVPKPTGRVYGTYGRFGTGNLGVNLAYGGQKWGNFIAVNGLNSGRFLDGPEVAVLHDRGNQENLFDRVDYQVAGADTIHANFGFTRSWFQNPNTWDQQLHTCSAGFTCNSAGVAVSPVNGAPLGPTDQRSQIKTFNFAPTWTHLIRHEGGVHIWRFRPERPIQLLPERRSVCRFFSSPAGPDDHARPETYQCRCAVRHFLREGHPQHKGGNHISTLVSDGERQTRHGPRVDCYRRAIAPADGSVLVDDEKSAFGDSFSVAESSITLRHRAFGFEVCEQGKVELAIA